MNGCRNGGAAFAFIGAAEQHHRQMVRCPERCCGGGIAFREQADQRSAGSRRMPCRRADPERGRSGRKTVTFEDPRGTGLDVAGNEDLESSAVIRDAVRFERLAIPLCNARCTTGMCIQILFPHHQDESGEFAFADAYNMPRAQAKHSAAEAVVDVDQEVIARLPDAAAESA